MYRNLSPWAIGANRGDLDIFQAAASAGFQGIDPDLAPLLDGCTPDEFMQPYQASGLRLGSWGLPVSVRGTDQEFQQGLVTLERMAEAAGSIGADRCATWILPYSETLTYDENFSFHALRLKPCAEILASHGCRLGLEFIGPRTLRHGKPYEFIHTLGGMLELARSIGTGNVGLLLDSWHWYTSHGTVDDLLKLHDGDVVVVHINDAPAGIPVDEQIDNKREVKGATGIINLTGFLSALGQIGYSGPVSPEPFNEALSALPSSQSVAAAGGALVDVWNRAFPES